MISKKLYEKPAMQLYEFKQRPQILVGSGEGGATPYDPQTPETW